MSEVILNADRKDFFVVVNTIDIENQEFTFVPYVMQGDGVRYPELTTLDVNEILNKITPYEIANNRIPIDVVSCVLPGGSLKWDTPGIEGPLDATMQLVKIND